MNQVDQEIMTTLDSVINTAPPPVSADRISARVADATDPDPDPATGSAPGAGVPVRLTGLVGAGSKAAGVVATAGVLAVVVLVVGAVVVVAMAVALRGGDAGPDGDATVEVQAVDQVEGTQETTTGTTDGAADPDPDGAVTAEARPVTIEPGRWVGELVPEIAAQVDWLGGADIWSALAAGKPQPLYGPVDPAAVAGRHPALTATRLRWEGLLLPGSYPITDGTSAAELITAMHTEFLTVTEELGYNNAEETFGLSPYELVIVASLVEAEAVAEADRAKVAAVVHNRLAAGMFIGIDAPYLYQEQDRGLELTAELLDTDGWYSTRVKPGLPATPIGAAGPASLKAAIDPADGQWLYYAPADEQGGLVFATTLDEHNNNVVAARERGLLGQ